MRTHQEIADELARQYTVTAEIIRRENEAQRVRVAALQQECGAIGHIFAAGRDVLTYKSRACVICGTPEPAATEGA